MEDRFVRGLVAGMTGGIGTGIASYFSGTMGTSLIVPEWLAIFLFAHKPPFDRGETLFAYFALIGMSGVLGVMFAYLVLYISSRNLLLKGWIFAITIWFTIFSITTLFQLPGTVPTAFSTVVSNWIETTVFGLSLAITLRALTKEESTNTLKLSLTPARKPLESDEDNTDKQ